MQNFDSYAEKYNGILDKKKLRRWFFGAFVFINGGEAGIRTLVTLRVNSISSAAQSTTLSPLRDKGVDSLNAY